MRRPGIAIGLAYTPYGGEALLIETTRFPGRGNLKLTGKLGDVMKESVTTALSWIRSNMSQFNVIDTRTNKVVEVREDQGSVADQEEQFFSRFDLHVHFPAAAIPKDGPSAGITITTAIVSLLTQRRVRKEIAMTGEVSLNGDVLPIGGVKEKCIAAHRYHIKEVILPEANRGDKEELPPDVANNLK